MSRLIAMILILFCCAAISPAQEIKVNPKGVNVNSQGATTVFLTFGGLGVYRAAEANWCGELIPADPDLGFKCNPATIYGEPPARYDLARRSGAGAYTDIMSIPPSVARRAYQSAAAGQESRFFYVRRFVSAAGGPDQYVDVTCRLTGGGARTPFSLTDVRLSFGASTDKTNQGAEPLALFVESGKKLPPIRAKIAYTGAGRLKGRWEIVQPGDEPPDARDLLTEATLPIEERALQRRFTELSRFNVFLPPTGRFILQGPDTARLPNSVAGQYLILLRVEATDDREADSDLAAVGASAGVAHNGGVAGFPMPALRYIVGGSDNAQAISTNAANTFTLLLPADSAAFSSNQPVDFSWTETAAAFYRVEVEDAEGKLILSAALRAGIGAYRAPSWLKDRAGNQGLRWRVVALDQTGTAIGETPRRSLRINNAP